MAPFLLAGRSVEIEPTGDDKTRLLVDATTRARLLRFFEDGAACAELRAGRLPALAEPICARLLPPEDSGHLAKAQDPIEQARAATAEQLWDKYAGGWRAGDRAPADKAAFARALGPAEIMLYLAPDGAVSMAQLCWANTNLFWGHRIFTSVFQPATWSDFDATLFG